jgi:KDO2-lipid IV(A) lauroyltransferase
VGEPAPVCARRSVLPALVLGLIIAAVRALGPLRRGVGGVIGSIWYRAVDDGARRRVAANHRRLHPALGERSATALARASFREYVAMILDSIWAEPLTVAQIRRHVRFVGLDNLAQGDDGAVLALSHFGNWDMAASGALALGRAVSTVMAPIGSQFLTAIVEVSRARKGLELFTPEQAARGLVRTLRHRRLIAIMSDVPEAGPTVTVPFCGGPVRFTTVPARLAAAAGKPIIPVACWRQPPGWVLEFYAPILTAGLAEAAVMARVAAVLEPEIRRHPEQWYPFHEVYADAG